MDTLLLTAYRMSPAPCPMVPSPTFYDFPFTHNTAILRYYPSRSSKVNDLYVIWKPVCNFLLVINSNQGFILHRLATVHPWQTDRRTDGRNDRRQLMPYLSTFG